MSTDIPLMATQGMRDGWAMGRDNESRKNIYVPPPGTIFGILQKKAISVDLSNSALSRKWTD